MTKNAIVESAANGWLADNEFSVDDYIEYLREMDPADFRKYYGTASIDEAERELRKTEDVDHPACPRCQSRRTDVVTDPLAIKPAFADCFDCQRTWHPRVTV